MEEWLYQDSHGHHRVTYTNWGLASAWQAETLAASSTPSKHWTHTEPPTEVLWRYTTVPPGPAVLNYCEQGSLWVGLPHRMHLAKCQGEWMGGQKAA